MSRSEDLDAMGEAGKEADILRSIREHGCIRITTRQALAFWGDAVDRLRQAGRVRTELVEHRDDQCSWIQVTAPEPAE